MRDGGARAARNDSQVPRIPHHQTSRPGTAIGRIGAVVREFAATRFCARRWRRTAATDRWRDVGHYVTDGVRLFRNVSPLRGPFVGTFVGLEDCRSLEIVLMPIADYVRLRDVPVLR
jgi:hypothetical protein